ncbi:MAG TPA: ester cyclase [Labilithrix sp.]|jgi:predicted ester cyclase
MLGACGGGDEPKTAQNPPAPTVTPPAPTATEAPKAEDPKPAPLSPMEAQKKTGMGIQEAMNAHDAKKLASYFTDDAVVKVIGMPDVTGRDAIQAQYDKMFVGLPNLKNGAARVFVTKDGPTIVEWAAAGKHTGEMFGMKGTEKDVGFMGVSVIWFSPDGTQVKEEHVYHDVGTIMSQLGVSKQKARPIPTIPTGMPQVFVPGGADEQKNLDATNKMNGAFEKKSEADFIGGVADDVQWDDMTQPDTMKGKDSGKKFFKMFMTAFPDGKVTDAKVWAVGDYVINESTFSGTHKGVLFGAIQPTKKQVTLHGIDIIQYKDGKAVHGWSYGNSGEMMAQLGLLPKMGDAKAQPPAPKK